MGYSIIYLPTYYDITQCMHVPKIILLRLGVYDAREIFVPNNIKNSTMCVLGYSILNDSHALAYQILLCFYERYLTPNEL